MTAPADIIVAYRHLLRASLRAVHYSKPARYTLHYRLRDAFRSSPPTAYDTVKLERTLEFLRGAAERNELEHRVLRVLTHYWWQDLPAPWGAKKGRVGPEMVALREDAKKDVDVVLREMGRTMNMYV